MKQWSFDGACNPAALRISAFFVCRNLYRCGREPSRQACVRSRQPSPGPRYLSHHFACSLTPHSSHATPRAGSWRCPFPCRPLQSPRPRHSIPAWLQDHVSTRRLAARGCRCPRMRTSAHCSRAAAAPSSHVCPRTPPKGACSALCHHIAFLDSLSATHQLRRYRPDSWCFVSTGRYGAKGCCSPGYVCIADGGSVTGYACRQVAPSSLSW